MMQITATERANALAELGTIFEYPTSAYKAVVHKWIACHEQKFPTASEALKQFAQTIEHTQANALEEIYTRTFDMAPVCSPYISGHIYGSENFERGTLLTALNDRYQSVSFDRHGELPDHLALILRFAPNMTEEELDELSEYCLSKPLDEMISALSGNPYVHAVMAVKSLLYVDGAKQ